MQIFCAHAGLHRFKIRASRQLPHEYVELLFGERLPSGFHIFHFEMVPHKGKQLSIEYDDTVAEQVISDTEARTGFDYLGTLHSHTEAGNPDPSPADNAGARECSEEEHFFGIDAISVDARGRRKHTVTFWPPQEPFELLVVGADTTNR